VVVRVAVVADAEQIAAIYRPYVESTAISFEERPPSADEVAGRIEATLRSHPWLVLDQHGALLGYAYASEHRARPAYRWSADVTIYVADRAHRCGVGRRLYEALLDILRRQGIHNAFAGITLPNPASIGLHEACGFACIGTYRAVGFKLGRWRDVGWWQKPIGTVDGVPPDVTPFSALRVAGSFHCDEQCLRADREEQER
jgi:L-amino acid N-acyltransferase YncA